MADYILPLVAVKTVTVALGAIFLGFTWRAWRKHRAPSMAWLALAIFLLTIAAVVEAFTFQVVGLDIDLGHLIEGLFTFAGFAVLVFSVFAHKVA